MNDFFRICFRDVSIGDNVENGSKGFLDVPVVHPGSELLSDLVCLCECFPVSGSDVGRVASVDSDLSDGLELEESAEPSEDSVSDGSACDRVPSAGSDDRELLTGCDIVGNLDCISRTLLSAHSATEALILDDTVIEKVLTSAGRTLLVNDVSDIFVAEVL